MSPQMKIKEDKEQGNRLEQPKQKREEEKIKKAYSITILKSTCAAEDRTWWLKWRGIVRNAMQRIFFSNSTSCEF